MKILPLFALATLLFAAPFASADWLAGGFGNPTTPVAAPALKTGPDQVPSDAGLLLDMRVFNGCRVRDAQDVQRAWEQSGPAMAQTG